MQSTLMAGDKTVRKQFLKGAGKTKTSIAKSEMAKARRKYTDSSKSKECGNKLSSNEITRHSTYQLSDNKTILYKNMRKVLETKYKKIRSSTSSREKLSPEKNRYYPKVYNLTNSKEKTTFSRNKLIKSSSISDLNTLYSRNSLKEENYQKYHSTQISLPTYTLESKIEINYQDYKVLNSNKTEEITNIPEKCEEPPIKNTNSYDDSYSEDDKNWTESKTLKVDTNSTMEQGNNKRYKISKRLASLAQHKELPIPVRKDLSFRPFKVPKRALLYRATQRILELAKPIPKSPPVNILPPEKAFTVKKRSLNAKCSKRLSELAFPIMRPEEYQIKPEYPFYPKRRSLRAKCSKRVKELAKPLPRRCRSPVRTSSKNVRVKA